MSYGHKDHCNHPGSKCTCDNAMTNKKEDSVEWREWTLGTYHLTAVVVDGPKYAKNREINVIEKAAFTALLSDYRELEDNLIELLRFRSEMITALADYEAWSKKHG